MTQAFVVSQVMDAGCRPAKRWMSSALHLGWTNCGLLKFILYGTLLPDRIVSGLRTTDFPELLQPHVTVFQNSSDDC